MLSTAIVWACFMLIVITVDDIGKPPKDATDNVVALIQHGMSIGSVIYLVGLLLRINGLWG